jgi:FkbM family methyltransferase
MESLARSGTGNPQRPDLATLPEISLRLFSPTKTWVLQLLDSSEMPLKDLIKQVIPHGLCEYSIRRHDYMRLGFGAMEASWIALSARQHRDLCDSRLDLLPKEILSKLSTCVDAGAHAGNWTAALLERFNPERVIAVECEPRLVGPLRARFAAFPLVSVVDAALAESEGTASFHQLRHPASSSLLKPRADVVKEFLPNSWDLIGTVDVRKISYDQLVAAEKEISILKLDIQGAEMGMLAASRDGIEKTDCVIMEVTFTSHYEGDSGFPELHQCMAGRGFGLYRLSAPYNRGGRILFADAVYVREKILAGEKP